MVRTIVRVPQDARPGELLEVHIDDEQLRQAKSGDTVGSSVRNILERRKVEDEGSFSSSSSSSRSRSRRSSSSDED